MWRLACALILTAAPALADVVVAARTIRAQTVLGPADLKLTAGNYPGALDRIEDAVGMETRVVLYAGRPVGLNDIGSPAIIDRNQIVTLLYDRGGLTIATEGRALGRGGVGDRLRVMNIGSRKTVTGTVQSDGTVTVGGPGLPSG